MDRLRILVAGRDSGEIDAVIQMLSARKDLEPEKRLIVNGHMDPLYSVPSLPDVLIYLVSRNWAEELAALADRGPGNRPSIIVIGRTSDPAVMRLAMQAGADDFLTEPDQASDLYGVLDRISRRRTPVPGRSQLIAVLGAKGGVGSSTLVANLAHALARRGDRTLLMDLNLQFGSLAGFFDLPATDGLIESVARVDSLDSHALEAYILKHDSGLHLLGSAPDQVLSRYEIPDAKLARLVKLLDGIYQHICIDLPKRIDPMTGLVLEKADRLLLVIQQTVVHLREAKQLVAALKGLGIGTDRVTVVVNRYEKRSAIQQEEICQALQLENLFYLPNDFSRIAEAGDLGMPLLEAIPNAAISRRLQVLTDIVAGDSQGKKDGIGRFLPKWARL